MPIRCRLPEVRARAGRLTLTRLAADTGIALSTLSRLDSGKTKSVEFGTLEAICQRLNVQPGDLFEYVPGNEPAQASATPASVEG